jgi:hypothetical protein
MVLFFGFLLLVERNLELRGQLLGIERTARKIPFPDLQRRHSAPAPVDADNEIFAVGIFFNVHFAIRDPAFCQKVLQAPAVRAPERAVDDQVFRHISRRMGSIN